MDSFKRCKMRGTSQVSERGLVSDWLEGHKRLFDWFKMQHAFRGPIMESYTRSFLPVILPHEKHFITIHSQALYHKLITRLIKQLQPSRQGAFVLQTGNLLVFGSSSASGKGFVCDEEDFLEAATGVLRSIMEKLVSLQEPQVSTSFTNKSFLKQIVPRQQCLGLATATKKEKIEVILSG